MEISEGPDVTGVIKTGATTYDILFTGKTGRLYQLQESTSLTTGWTNVGAVFSCQPGVNPLPRQTSARRMFWRVSVVP